MRMNRRNVLAGIGALTAGGGAIFGSGAFSQVEAERSATIAVANDANGYLALQPTDDSTDSGYVQTDSDNEIVFFFDGRQNDGGGLNKNAITQFEDLITVTNNGTNEVTLTVTPVDDSGNEFDPEGSDDPDPGFSVIEGDVTLSDGGSETIGFEFNLVEGDAEAYNDSTPSVASFVIDAST